MMKWSFRQPIHGNLLSILFSTFHPMLCNVLVKEPISLTIFPSQFKSQWKFDFVLNQILKNRSLQNFAHDMTAVLSCHVQKFVVIYWPRTEWHQHENSIKIELWVKNREWDGSQVQLVLKACGRRQCEGDKDFLALVLFRKCPEEYKRNIAYSFWFYSFTREILRTLFSFIVSLNTESCHDANFEDLLVAL